MDELSDWTKRKQMKLNVKKSNYMIINYTKKYQFNTRLSMEGTLLEQVHQTKLLGLIISDDLFWKSNSEFIIKKAYTRMTLLHKLFEFNVPEEEPDQHLHPVHPLCDRAILCSLAQLSD